MTKGPIPNAPQLSQRRSCDRRTRIHDVLTRLGSEIRSRYKRLKGRGSGKTRVAASSGASTHQETLPNTNTRGSSNAATSNVVTRSEPELLYENMGATCQDAKRGSNPATSEAIRRDERRKQKRHEKTSYTEPLSQIVYLFDASVIVPATAAEIPAILHKLRPQDPLQISFSILVKIKPSSIPMSPMQRTRSDALAHKDRSTSKRSLPHPKSVAPDVGTQIPSDAPRL